MAQSVLRKAPDSRDRCYSQHARRPLGGLFFRLELTHRDHTGRNYRPSRRLFRGRKRSRRGRFSLRCAIFGGSDFRRGASPGPGIYIAVGVLDVVAAAGLPTDFRGRYLNSVWGFSVLSDASDFYFTSNSHCNFSCSFTCNFTPNFSSDFSSNFRSNYKF